MLQVLNGPNIEAGESLSEAVDCSAGQMVRITMPVEWTDAVLTFQFSTDGVMFNEVCDIDGRAITIQNIWPGSGVIISSDVGRAVAFVKFRSGTAGNPIVQEERRQFAIAIRLDEAAAPEPPARSAKKKAPAKKAAKKKKK